MESSEATMVAPSEETMNVRSEEIVNDDIIQMLKIFVGGLPHNIDEEEFKAYFERFGSITDIVIIHDKQTGKARGFGFVTFESEESVKNVLQRRFYDLKNKRVEVQRARPKEPNIIVENNIYGPLQRDLGFRYPPYFVPQVQYYCPNQIGPFVSTRQHMYYPPSTSTYMHSYYPSYSGGFPYFGYNPYPNGGWSGKGRMTVEDY